MADNFRMEGFDKVVNLFSGMLKRVNGGSEINKTIAAMGFRDVMDHFRDEKDEDGRKWERWVKKGQRVSTRPTKRGGNKMLQDTGAMRNAVKFKGTKNEAIIYIISKIANFHHEGTKKMAKRRFMYVTDNVFGKMASLYAKYLVKK